MSNPTINQSLSTKRTEYGQSRLSKDSAAACPVEQLELWLNEAIDENIIEPNAMLLATCGPDGMPDARIVLLKGIDKGLIFYTNYQSKKAQDLESNKQASITFFWPQLERQIRARGPVEKVSSNTSDTYFASRPVGSQISAIISPQSQTIESKEMLEEKRAELENQNAPVDRPSFWGGYELIPTEWEFWQGRPCRLHDRICYKRDPTTQAWTTFLKAP